MAETSSEVTGKKTRSPITWETPEYLHTDKTPDWYWALGLIAVAGAVAALLFNNVLFAIFILIAAFVLAIFASRKPETVTFAITQRGVRVNDELYPYQSLKSFAIDERSAEDTPTLILELRSMFSPHLMMPIQDVDPDDVHDFLLDFLPEEDHVEPLIHKVMEWLGF